jgi:uncharacterized protein (TIGR03435 family)
MNLHALRLAAVACVPIGVLLAQGIPVAFDVATVKPYTAEPKAPINTFLSGGRYAASSATLQSIVILAYQPLTAAQIVGAPAWAAAERFEIQAKAQGNPNVDALRGMLRSLLADRFTLRTHTEKRDSTVYALRLARGDGRVGPNLKPATVDCSERRSDAPPPDAEPQPLSNNCAFFTRVTNYVGIGIQMAASAKGATVAQLAAQLSGTAAVGGRVVVDNSGLTGHYDIDLAFAPTPSGGLNAASVFTAVEEQLGLKLDTATMPVDFLVIDSVDHPTAD